MKGARIHHSLPVLPVTYQTLNQEVTGDHSTGGTVVADENVTSNACAASASTSRSPDNPLTPTATATATNYAIRSPSAHSRSSSCLIGHRYWHNQYVTDPLMMANLCQSPVETTGHLDMDEADVDCRFVVTDAEDNDGQYSQLPTMADTSPMTRASEILTKHQGDLEEALGRLEAADQVYKSILSMARHGIYDCDQQVFQDVTCSSPVTSYSKFTTDGDDEVDDFELQSHLGHQPPAITTELVDEEDEINESFFLTADIETIRQFLKSHSQFLSELSEYESAIHNILLQGQSLLALISVNCRRMSQQPPVNIEIKVTTDSTDEPDQNLLQTPSSSSSSPPQATAGTTTTTTNDQMVHLASPKSDHSSPILKLNGSTLNLLKSHASQIRTKFTCLLDTVQEREESLTRALIATTQRHLDNLKSWTLYAEDRIVYFEEIGPDFESLIRQCEDHRVLQDELDDQQATLDIVTSFLAILEDENNEFGLHISSSLLADFNDQVSNLIRDKWNHLSSSIIERSAILSVIHDEWSNLNQLEEQIKHLAGKSVKCQGKSKDEEQMKSLPCHSKKGDSPTEEGEVNLDMDEVNLDPSVKASFGSSCENVPGTNDTDNESLEELMANLVDSADSLLTQLTCKCPTVSIHPDTINEVRSQMSRLQESLNQIKVTLETSNCNPSPGQSLTLPSDHNSGELTNDATTGDEKYPCCRLQGTTSCSGEFKVKCDESQDEMDNSNNCNINVQGECLTINQTNTGLLNNSSPGSTRTAMTSLSNPDDDRLFQQQHHLHHQDQLQLQPEQKRSQQLPDPCIPHAWRVKEWQRDMETVSTWLGRIEDDLGLEDDLSENGSVIWDHLSHQEQLFLLNDISLSVTDKTNEVNSLIHEGHEIIAELQSVGKPVKIYSELLSTVTLRWSMIQQEVQVKTEAIESEDIPHDEQCTSATGDSTRDDSLDIDSPTSGAVEMADMDSYTPDHMIPPRSPWMSHGPLVGQITRWQRAAETLSIWLGRIEDDLGLDDGDVNCAVVIWDELSIEEQQGLLEDSTAAVNEKSQEIESLITSGKKISATIKSLESSSSTSSDSLPMSTIRPFNELLRSLIERWSLVKNELESKKLRIKAISELHQLNMEVESMRRVLVSHQKWLQVTESLLNQSCNLTKLMTQFKLRSRSMNIQKERLDKVKDEIAAIINNAPFDLTNNDSYKSLQCFIQCWQVIYDRNNQLSERIKTIASSDHPRRSESTDEELISISEENLSEFLLHPPSKSPDDSCAIESGDSTGLPGDTTTSTKVDSATLVTASNESSTLISGRFSGSANYSSPLLKNSPLEPSPATSGSIGESSVTTSHEKRSMNPMSVYQSSVAYQVLPEEDEEQEVIHMATDETKQLVTLEEDDEYEEVEVEVDDDDDDEYEEVEEGTDSDINCATNEASLLESSATKATIDPPDSTSMVLSNIFSSLEQVEDEFHQEILQASNVQSAETPQVTDSIESNEMQPLIAHEIIPQSNFFTTEGGRGSEQQYQQRKHHQQPSSDQGTCCSSSSTSPSTTTTTTTSDSTIKSLFRGENCIKCNSSRCNSITINGHTAAGSDSTEKKFILEQSLQSTAIQFDQSSQETSVQIDSQFNGYTCPSCIVNINTNSSLLGTNVTDHQHGHGGDGGRRRRRHGRKSPFGQDTGHSLPTQRSTSTRKGSFSSRIESTLVTLIQYLAVLLLIGLQAISLSIIGLTLFLFLSWMSLVLLLAIAAASAIVKIVLIYTSYLLSPTGQVLEQFESPMTSSMPWLTMYSLGHGGLLITNAFNVTLFLACLFFVILSFNILAYKNKLHMSLYLPGKNGSSALSSSSTITKTTTLGLAFIWTHIFKVSSITSSTVSEVKGSTQYEFVDETLHESSLSLSEMAGGTSDMSGYLTWTWLPFKFCITNYTWIPLLKLNRSKSKYPVTQM